MNVPLAREIYGQPWLVDAVSLQGLTALLRHYKKGGDVPTGEKANAYGFYDFESKAFVTDRVWRAKENADQETVSVIRLDGAITKNGGGSSNGTVHLAKQLERFDKLKNVIGHVLVVDSGGGSSIAMKYMENAITEAKKPVVVSAEDLMASAAYGIATKADHIMAQNNDTRVGSIGVMIEFSGLPKIAEDNRTGERSVRIYADQSTEKNNEFEEAINNLNFQPVKEEILNPVAEKFINAVKDRRPNVTDKQLKGGVFEADQVVGTLIDSIGSFEDAVNKVKELSVRSGLININKNNIRMTQSELKAQNPELCSALITQGVEQERKRVRTILKFSHIDAKACAEMVTSGNEPDSEFFADMQLKAISSKKLEEIEKETTEEITVDTSKETAPIVEKETKQKSDFNVRMRTAAGLKEEEGK